jgi:hypothetical protein
MSIVGPGAGKTAASRPSQPAGVPKPAPRPAGGVNGAAQVPQLKRKASGPADGTQVKMQRKDSPSQPVPTNGSARSAAPAAAKPNPPTTITTTTTTTTTTVPYRGTAAPASTRPASPMLKKPVVPASTSTAPARTAPPPPKPVSSASTAPASKPKGYLALLQKAKEKDLTKPAAPPVKNEPPKILTKKERMALKAESSASAKGKKPAPGPLSRTSGAKVDPAKDKKKPADLGYQGTARPAKKPAEPLGYRGTARPASVPVSSSRAGTPAAKPKPKAAKGRWDGYAEWSDLDDMDDEDPYESDASSDMEGGIWDVEQEEQLALKAARKEDAEALAEEMRLKREKEEKKRKLMALSKAAAAKKKY